MSYELVFWSAVVAAFAYEVFAIATHKTSTISALVWKWSIHPIVPFLFGVVMGHFFWRLCPY